MSQLPFVEVVHSPAMVPDASVIWLHGLGADGHDFVPVVQELGLPESMSVRFIFPHAPEIPVTINGGYVMRAWYDILEMSLERKVDSVQLEANAKAIHALIEQEISRGIRPERIVIAGFSQGGAVAYQAALTCPSPLAGLLVLSSYLATAETLTVNPANEHMPVLIQHGTQDDVVPEVLGERAVAALASKNISADYQTFSMAHTLCLPQLQSISSWLQTTLAR